MKAKTLRVLAAVFVVAVMLAACGNEEERGKENTPTPALSEGPSVTHEVTPAVTATSTPRIKPTPIMTPTPTPVINPTPTMIPTPTPITDYTSADILAKNRELHKITNPKREIAALGTGPACSDLDIKDYEYGIRRNYAIQTEDIMFSSYTSEFSRPVQRYDEQGIRSIHISGLKDGTVQNKINKRIDEVVKTLANPSYIPNSPGVIKLFREKGTPKRYTETYATSAFGYLSVESTLRLVWEEAVHLDDTDRAGEYAASVWPNDGCVHFDYNYDVLQYDGTYVYYNANPGTVKFSFELRETSVLNFNLATGEEIRLSDLFPEGEDYLKLLNEEISKRLNYEYWNVADFGYGYFDLYKEEKEYDGGRVIRGLSGEESFAFGNRKNLFIFSDSFSSGSMEIPFPGPVPSVDSDDLYVGKCQYSVEPIGELYGKPYGMTGYIPAVAGEFTVQAQGQERKTLRVLLDDVGLFAISPINQKPVDSPYALSRDLVYKAVKEWAEHRFAEQSWAHDYDVYSVFPVNAMVYPNGYISVGLHIDGPNWDGWLVGGNGTEFWMKDGHFIEDKDVFLPEDPYETILWKLFRESGFNEEQAAYCAGILAPYVVSVRYYYFQVGMSDIQFRFEVGNPENPLTKEVQSKLTGHYPSGTLEWLFDSSSYESMPYINIIEYARAYEGYPFK